METKALELMRKAFTTLEQKGGTYSVVMRFEHQADAWAAYHCIVAPEAVAPEKCPGHGREVCAMCCWPPRKICDCNQGRLPCTCK